jgi:hypothetical protein
MTGRAKCLITLGRGVVLLTHVWECAILVLTAFAATHLVITGGDRLKLDEPWDSMLFYAVVAPSHAVLPSWGAFCLAFAVLLRRRGQAGSRQQFATILRVAVPFLGLGYYDRIIRRLTDPRGDAVSCPQTRAGDSTLGAQTPGTREKMP